MSAFQDMALSGWTILGLVVVIAAVSTALYHVKSMAVLSRRWRTGVLLFGGVCLVTLSLTVGLMGFAWYSHVTEATVANRFTIDPWPLLTSCAVVLVVLLLVYAYSYFIKVVKPRRKARGYASETSETAVVTRGRFGAPSIKPFVVNRRGEVSGGHAVVYVKAGHQFHAQAH